MRLIDADALCLGKFVEPRTEWHQGWNDALDAATTQAPTIDAVPVVRCKDCKRGEVDDPEYDPDLYYCELGCGWNKGYFFCSYGERKDGDD